MFCRQVPTCLRLLPLDIFKRLEIRDIYHRLWLQSWVFFFFESVTEVWICVSQTQHVINSQLDGCIPTKTTLHLAGCFDNLFCPFKIRVWTMTPASRERSETQLLPINITFYSTGSVILGFCTFYDLTAFVSFRCARRWDVIRNIR